jgi:hypothetical protein
MEPIVRSLQEAVAADCRWKTIIPDERGPSISFQSAANPGESAAPLTGQSMIETFQLLDAPASPLPSTGR